MAAALVVGCALARASGAGMESATLPAPMVEPTDAEWAKLGAHPRLLAGAARFEALKLQGDDVTKQLRVVLQHAADRALVAGPIEFPATGFLMGPMREVQGRILALAMQYRLTGEKKYFDKARRELLTLAALPEWRPSHFLDVGEAALAAGVGLDWLYDDLSPQDRDAVSDAIVKNAIEPSLKVPDGGDSWVHGDFNWTQVCHCGVVVAALAIAEREPELARKVVDRAVTNFDRVGAGYAPDGSYAEGPSYWSYGTSFHVILIEALRSALGTGCGLEKFPGFLQTADFNDQMVAPTGEEFNYSDYHKENLNEPIMLWFARERQERAVARDEFGDLARLAEQGATHVEGAPLGGEMALHDKRIVASRHVPFELLWWDPALPGRADSRVLHWTASGVLPLAVMRSAWDDSNAAFVAVKGGTPNHSHAHMDVGSFVLEAGGVRWALDLGTENYGLMRKANLDLWNYSQDSNRWSTFRVGPEGHNILRFDGARQDVSGKGEITALPDETGVIGNVVDLTSLYRNQVAAVHRTIRLLPDRSIRIEDQWTAGDHAVNASFQWLTKATVARTEKGLRLTQSGKSLDLRIETPGVEATMTIEDVSKPRATQDSPNPGVSRIVISLPTPARGSATLRVLAIPGGVSR